MKTEAGMMGWCLGLVCVSGLGLGTGMGAEPGPGGAEARVAFQERRERLWLQMRVELESMCRICVLDEKQKQRLEVAARGVVEGVLEDGEGVVNREHPVEWRWDEDVAGAKAYMLAYPLWRSVVEEVLTKEQMAAWEAGERAERRWQRDSAIRVAVGLMQKELRFTEEQRDQMLALMDRTMPEGFCEPETDVRSYTHWLDVKEVRNVLSKTQFEYWLNLQQGRTPLGERLLDR